MRFRPARGETSFTWLSAARRDSRFVSLASGERSSYSPWPRNRSFIDVNIGKMHGSIWWMVACERLIDLICARSPGVMGPLSFASLRRTSFSRASSSPKSMLAGCALQSEALFFTKAGAGGGGGVGGGGGGGSAAEGAADAAAGAWLAGSSHATRASMAAERETSAAAMAFFMGRELTKPARAGAIPAAPRAGPSRPRRTRADCSARGEPDRKLPLRREGPSSR